MNINYLLIKNNTTKYKLSKATNIPYTTINDICNNVTSIENCSVKTIHAIAEYFNTTIEELVYDDADIRYDFEAFKSNVCHELKELGYKKFVVDLLKRDLITKYFSIEWYPEALYLLAMLDYVSRINNIPICTRYDKYRTAKLNNLIYPKSVIVQADIMSDEGIKIEAYENAIPEFLKFNIVESDVLNIV